MPFVVVTDDRSTESGSWLNMPWWLVEAAQAVLPVRVVVFVVPSRVRRWLTRCTRRRPYRCRRFHLWFTDGTGRLPGTLSNIKCDEEDSAARSLLAEILVAEVQEIAERSGSCAVGYHGVAEPSSQACNAVASLPEIAGCKR